MEELNDVYLRSKAIVEGNAEDRYTVLTILFSKIIRSMRRIKAEAMERFDLKGSHISCIYNLSKSPKGLTNKELCEVCNEDKAAISRSLSYLEENKYVTYNKTDKIYKTPITLTKKGKEIGNYLTNKINSIFVEASVDIAKEDLEAFYRGLLNISENLDKITKGE